MQSKEQALQIALAGHSSAEVQLHVVHAYIFCGFSKKASVSDDVTGEVSGWVISGTEAGHSFGSKGLGGGRGLVGREAGKGWSCLLNCPMASIFGSYGNTRDVHYRLLKMVTYYCPRAPMYYIALSTHSPQYILYTHFFWLFM